MAHKSMDFYLLVGTASVYRNLSELKNAIIIIMTRYM